MTPEYSAFLARKALRAPMRGVDHLPDLANHLFPFQRETVAHSLLCGSAGVFLDTGLGKTEIQLEWSEHARRATNGRALILTPLAVAQQTRKRADRWGYEARVIRSMADVGDGINICNYDRLDNLDVEAFGCVSLDEASILKNFVGKTTKALIKAFSEHRFRLVATATPAPNDNMELGNYAEFLGLMQANEMLSRWFINDTSTASQNWRLKAHAERDFWDWMSSWARLAEKPSDLGDCDDGFDLPPLNVIRHQAGESQIKSDGHDLFASMIVSATKIHDLKRQTTTARADCLAGLVDPSEPWLIWCDTDYESDALKRAIPYAIEVRGLHSIDEKESRLEAFASGEAKTLIAKPSMCGFGLDWSHCANMAFVGRSYSYETWYQAVRRCWRFGQTRPVLAHLIVAEGETEIGRVIDRKAGSHSAMKIAMREAMKRAQGRQAITKVGYEPNHQGRVPEWLRSVA